MGNLLRNPNLQGFTIGSYFTSADGNTGTIENPNEWEFIGISNEPDPQMLPGSYHRDQGFNISAGWRRWEGGYVQRNIPLQAGQRYLMKAAILPNINFAHNPHDPNVIGVQFVIEVGGNRLTQDWQIVTYGQYQEPSFVFQSAVSGMATFQFRARSVWASNSLDLNVFALVLEDVAADFGGVSVPSLGGVPTPIPPTPPAQPVQSVPATPVQTAAPVTPAQPAAQPIGQPAQPTAQPIGQRGGSGGSMGSTGSTAASAPHGATKLEDVLTNDDIAVIVAGLRAMPQITNHPTVLQGMERLAQVLERLRK